MKKLGLILSLLLQMASLAAFAQNNQKKVDSIQYRVPGYNEAGALQDIRRGEIHLLLPGGFAGTKIDAGDKVFENRYQVKYLSQGCVRFPDENEAAYNKVMFRYLDKKYGDGWRKAVRQDVIGLGK